MFYNSRIIYGQLHDTQVRSRLGQTTIIIMTVKYPHVSPISWSGSGLSPLSSRSTFKSRQYQCYEKQAPRTSTGYIITKCQKSVSQKRTVLRTRKYNILYVTWTYWDVLSRVGGKVQQGRESDVEGKKLVLSELQEIQTPSFLCLEQKVKTTVLINKNPFVTQKTLS